jgi:phosphatidylserine/phosphatidylglycerophosphate/cardiolipin synthase-like enzyme
MGKITNVVAYCNNEVGYVAWSVDSKINGCLGFEVTRVYLDANGNPAIGQDGKPLRVKTVAFVPFEGQKNPDHAAQDTGVWPVQKLNWRDLTLRKRRSGMARRPDEVRVCYEVRAVGNFRDGMEAVPSNGRETLSDGNGGRKPAYEGKKRPLGYLGAAVSSNPIFVTRRLDPFQSTFTNGILAAQWLSNVLLADGEIKPGELIGKLSDPDDVHRKYLAGDVLPLLHELFARPGQFFLALYELEDRELVALLLANKHRIHVILANTGTDADKRWDARNAPARQQLIDAGVDIQHRMFNNSVHIGHNKFVVHVGTDGAPRAVFTGSTNWTATGLAGQTNNAVLIEDGQVAAHFLDYWNRMKADVLPVPQPKSMSMPATRQGAKFRADNSRPAVVPLTEGGTITTWFSPNTPQRKKPKNPPVPPDLAHVYRLMRKAEEAIFFLAFYPGQSGKDCIIGEAVNIGRMDSDLLVMGAVSSANAMPNYVPGSKGDDSDSEDDDIDAIAPTTFFENRMSIVRASRIEDKGIVGEFGKEVLSAGRAIIHDKIVVIDPLSDRCAVVFGSHNCGYKASYSNDENMLVVEGHRALAEAFMVHILDVYEHYRFRAIETDLRRKRKSGWSGFLQTNDKWQDRHLDGRSGNLSRYLTTRLA